MTKQEAYNKMLEGYCVSHKDFGSDEFLFMDESYIIRDETGEEFEESWDVRTGDSWETNWFIFKNKKLIDKAKALTDVVLDKVDTVTYIEGNTEREQEYRDRIASESVDNKILRITGEDFDSDTIELKDEVGQQEYMNSISESKKQIRFYWSVLIFMIVFIGTMIVLSVLSSSIAILLVSIPLLSILLIYSCITIFGMIKREKEVIALKKHEMINGGRWI